MTLNSSGPISLAGSTAGQSIALELGQSATGLITLNDSAVRTLAGVPSGAITMPTNFYGKSSSVTISYTFTSNTADASLTLSSISGYVAGKSNITVTINSGVYLYSTSTAGQGLNLIGGTTGDTIALVNNGFICGCGGAGNGTSGGIALNLASMGISSITVNNTNGSAYIGGGGGGGGTGAFCGSGGGAGGGQGITSQGGGASGNPGGPGARGNNAGGFCDEGYFIVGGGGGGRQFPGTGGASYGAGGGTGGAGGYNTGANGNLGAGGNANNPGGAGTGGHRGSGGGGWGASGGAPSPGAGGQAVNLGGKTVTWVSGDTSRVWGAVS